MDLLFALLLTAGATAIGVLLRDSVHAVNLALIYMAAVIVAAVYGSMVATFCCAIGGFLAFNFFFTQPRGTFLISEREEMLTAALFLLVAILVGPLASRLQVKVKSLELRDACARVEVQLLESLSAALAPKEIYKALNSALVELLKRPVSISIVDSANSKVPSSFMLDSLSIEENHRLAAVLRDKSKRRSALTLLNNDSHSVRAVADAERLFAIVSIPLQKDSSVDSYSSTIDILLHQCGLALGRKSLQDDLAKERVEKEQELLRSSLLSSVSHDFRTPLTAMIGATTTLMEMRGSLSDEQEAELLESVLSEAERLNNYTQNLLDMTRLGRGELKLDRSWVSIEEIVNIALKRIRPLAEAHKLRVDIEKDLPLLRVHPALIEQAIFNVLHNAIKFSPPDTVVQLTCMKVTSGSKTALNIEVLDEGAGIVAAEREKVFKMFHTAEYGDRRVAGSGLGLAICKGMIGAHGGGVEIDSGPEGVGCLVRMTLPVIEMEATAEGEADEHDTGD